MKIERFKCFGTTIDSGNKAFLFTGTEISGLSQEDRRKLAAESGKITSVFLEERITDQMPILDFHYPHMRSPLCLHASIAAAYHLFSLPGDHPTQSVFTDWTGQYLSFRKNGPTIFVRVTPILLPVEEFAVYTIAALLNCSVGAIASAPVVASVGSTKLLVELTNTNELYNLIPDLEAVVAFGRSHQINGIYAYVKTGEAQYEGRNFNHLDPLLEDTATGVAAGALTSILGYGINLYQGHIIGNPCKIVTLISGDQIEIGGDVNLY